MAADLTKKQLDAVSRLKTISATVVDQIRAAQAVVQEAVDLGFGTGGANAITDNLLQTGSPAPFPDLSAADIVAAVTILQKLDAALAATTVTTTGSTRVGYTALERMR